AHDEHMLREPALVTSLHAGDPKSMTLLAQERIAAVAGADAPDRPYRREVDDVPSLGREIAEAVDSANEIGRRSQMLERHAAHAGHDVEVRYDVRAVGE